MKKKKGTVQTAVDQKKSSRNQANEQFRKVQMQRKKMIEKLKTWVEATEIENSEFEYTFYSSYVSEKEPERGLLTEICEESNIIAKAQTVAFEVIN